MNRERRRAPRFQFIAPAELVEESSGTRIFSWVADLGQHGCSLSVRKAPRDGTVVRLKIGTTPRETFSAKAVVVHSEEERAGIAFEEVTPVSLEILGNWLSKAKFPTRRSFP
jgi:hypothetical protein